MGPDEYHDACPGRDRPGLDNNAYTNVLTVWVLRRALDALAALPEDRRTELRERLTLTRQEITRFEDVARKMYVPFHEGVISQFDGYSDLEELDWTRYRERYGDIRRLDRILEAEGDSPNRYKASKQADVLMLFYVLSPDELDDVLRQLGYEHGPALAARTIGYYLPRTCDGSTLSSLVHAWILARTDGDTAWNLFLESLLSDITDAQHGTTAEGVHLGAMAGTVDLVQRCHAGISTRGPTLQLEPRLPTAIGELRLGLRYRGHWGIDLTCRQDLIRVTLRPGAASPIRVSYRAEETEIQPGASWESPLRHGRTDFGPSQGGRPLENVQVRPADRHRIDPDDRVTVLDDPRLGRRPEAAPSGPSLTHALEHDPHIGVDVFGFDRHPVEKPVFDDPVQQVPQGVHVDVGAHLAVLLGRADPSDELLDVRFDDLREDGVQEVGVGLAGGDQASVGRSEAGGRDQVHNLRQLGPQVGGDVARVRKGDHEVEAVGCGLEHDRAFGGPPPVDGLLADAGSPGDRLDRDVVVPEFTDQGEGRVEDRAPGALAAPAGVWCVRGHPSIIPPNETRRSVCSGLHPNRLVRPRRPGRHRNHAGFPHCPAGSSMSLRRPPGRLRDALGKDTAMSELLVDFITSLDGYASGEGWPGFWGLEGPEYLAWLGEQPETTHLMGANTYRQMSGFAAGEVPNGQDEFRPEEEASVDELTQASKVVFSSSLEEPLTWANSTLVRDDAVEAVRAMKASGSGLLSTIGSLSLCRSLLRAGLVDRFRVVMFPVITGATGAERIYDGYPDVALEMIEHRTFDGRIQLVEYRPSVLEHPPLGAPA